MKCPIRYNVWVDNENKPILLDQDCLKADCEWWSETSQQCRVCAISSELYSLVEVMEEIRDQLKAQGRIMGIRE